MFGSDSTILLAASTGGHLAELRQIRRRLEASGMAGRIVWLTFDTAQSRSLLREEDHVKFIPYIGPRAGLSLIRTAPKILATIRRERPAVAISTGAAVATGVLTVASVYGARAIYIESAARTAGPSLTGRLLSLVPSIEKYCQYTSWASDKWPYVGSVFDGFTVTETPGSFPQRIFVSLGTTPFGFSRLVRALETQLPGDAEITWQIGATEERPRRGEVVESMSNDELAKASRDADVVVAHAGVGAALSALQVGKVPVLIPRAKDHGEHVDDHQHEIAADLSRRGLAIGVPVDRLKFADLQRAARQSADYTSAPLDLALDED